MIEQFTKIPRYWKYFCEFLASSPLNCHNSGNSIKHVTNIHAYLYKKSARHSIVKETCIFRILHIFHRPSDRNECDTTCRCGACLDGHLTRESSSYQAADSCTLYIDSHTIPYHTLRRLFCIILVIYR